MRICKPGQCTASIPTVRRLRGCNQLSPQLLWISIAQARLGSVKEVPRTAKSRARGSIHPRSAETPPASGSMPGGGEVVAGFVALSLLKKATVYGVARYYGFPRLYRKLVRFNLRLKPDPAQHARLKETTKRVMRLPNGFIAAIRAYRKSLHPTPVSTPATRPIRPQVNPRTRL